MIKVLIVEDSKVVQEFLAHIFTSDPSIQVVGVADNGEEALDAVKQKRPDVITMDIHMPKVDGFEATRAIMETVPTPIVIVTGSLRAKELASTFRAVEAGALAVVLRPPGIGHPEHETAAGELIRTVKLMSEVKVVRRWPRVGNKMAVPQRIEITGTTKEIQIVAMGASTGGPVALKTILSGLPKDFRPLHGLRHVFASMLASSGQVDMYTLQKLLTHKSPLMTQRYAHLRDDTLKRASNLAGDLINQAVNSNGELKKVVNFKK